MKEYIFIFLVIYSVLFHLVAFGLESVLFMKGAHKRFKVSKEDAPAVYPFALNQGFYNLFLAISMVVGLVFKLRGNPLGDGMLLTSAFVMVGAGVILAKSNKDLIRVGVLQGLPPAVIIYLLFSY
ncbi:MAG: putative membrane protein [Bacteriovoracaceae bacterium]|jgi:putative membrane protein